MMMRFSVLGRRQGGLTLIELLISLVVGVVVLGALLVVFLGSRAAYRSADNLGRVQESGRFAVEYIAQDARMAGFNGCRSRNLSTTTRYPTLINVTTQPAVPFNGAIDGVIGFEDGAGWANPTAITRVAGSDVLTVRRAVGTGISISANSDPAARTVSLVRQTNPPLRKGDTAVLASCERALLFRVTNDPPDPTKGENDRPTLLKYEAAVGSDPGNLASPNPAIPPFSMPVWDLKADLKLGTRAEVVRFIEASYFVGQTAAGRRSLYRAAGTAAEELVGNVEDMDIRYGVDSDEDGDVDGYWNAAQVPANGGWGRVVSARISVLIAGEEANITTGAQTFTLRDTTGDGVLDAQSPAQADGRLRHVFTTTVSLRNRTM